ncbi:MAG: 3-isopropylmalate dehydratase large subunit [Candidatus Woesebacteria bacterium]|jgi:3-isopropylmalate/(R)-2-methylmalate dehydratase large subunit
MKAKTMYEKIWEKHIVCHDQDAEPVIYIDTHLVHEVTSPQAFDGLRQRGLKLRRPDRTFMTIDHVISTKDPKRDFFSKKTKKMMKVAASNAQEFSVKLFDTDSKKQGVIHIIAPELGLIQPGMTIACGDSHTATHGAFGAIAFGIGTSEVECILASQCLLQKKMKTMEIRVDGKLGKGVTAKDLILAIINKLGVGGGTAYAVEYTGEAIRAMSMDERLTICNMSIEFGAKVGMIAADEITFAYLKAKEYAPKGEDFEKAVKDWKKLRTDKAAKYDRVIKISAQQLKPRVTYGISPDMNLAIDEKLPTKQSLSNETDREMLEQALDYMDFKEGEAIQGKEIQHVFIGSCTNGRLTDLEAAAKVLKGKKVAKGVTAVLVPGSMPIKAKAEEKGLDKIFKDAGFEWRQPGCSSCLAMNGDLIPAEEYCVSTTNRNFKGRQGKGARTILASPMMAAAAAITGKITDVKELL